MTNSNDSSDRSGIRSAIYYFLALGTDTPFRPSPFQGFSERWRHLNWVFPLLARCPANIFERSNEPDNVIAARMGQRGILNWIPQNIEPLMNIGSEEAPLPMFAVCFSGEDEVANRVEQWRATHPNRIMHVTTSALPNALHRDAFNDEELRKYCSAVFEREKEGLEGTLRASMAEALENWREPPLARIEAALAVHHATTPNKISLRRAWVDAADAAPLIGTSERDYIDAIISSATPIMEKRAQVGERLLHRVLPRVRPIALIEPSVLRQFYSEPRAAHTLQPPVRAVFNHIRTQKQFFDPRFSQFADLIRDSVEARSLMAARRFELDTFSAAVGLHVAQTCAAAIRVGPAVNHVFPALSNFARSTRAAGYAARQKSYRLFNSIQEQLEKAVGPERINFIKTNANSVQIISDAPLEWLPIDGLPLCLRFDCFRLNATPGNLLIQQLTEPPVLSMNPRALRKVLVVSAFEEDDDLRMVMRTAIEVSRPRWENRIEFVFKTATNVDEFVDAINSFDGSVMLFDGHGAHNADQPIAHLAIGSELVDVWALKERVNVPPIVLLSACDTHGVDASSHATTANGFLALGARSVVGTWLPVGGVESARFFVRLMLRFSEFAPAVLAAMKRSVPMTEMISGMLRMYFASDVLQELVGPPERGSASSRLQLSANLNINSGNPEWFDLLIEDIANFSGEGAERTREKVRQVTVLSEAIRYVHLGRPDTMFINDDSITLPALGVPETPPPAS